MIGEKFNFDDIFFRDLTVCLLNTMEGKIKWLNRFTDKDVNVDVPFYYSITGDERFLLDSFSDDIVSDNRYIELNTDSIPYGIITMTGFNIKSDEFANPNEWLQMVVENEKEMRKVLAKIRAIPIDVNYDVEIILDNEIDIFKCNQSLINTLWFYKYMYFEYNLMNIDAFLSVQDSTSIQINREKNLTNDNKISVKAQFTVSTYYPAFNSSEFFDIGYKETVGNGYIDNHGHHQTGDATDYGDINKFINSQYGVLQNDNAYNGEEISYPKKTRWYNNIIKAREDAIKKITMKN